MCVYHETYGTEYKHFASITRKNKTKTNVSWVILKILKILKNII